MLLALALLLIQAPPQDDKNKPDISLDANGAHLKTSQLELNLGGRYIVVGRFFDDQDNDFSGNSNADVFRDNGFYNRQVRIEIWGTFRKIWEYKISADLVTSTPTLADGYVGYIGTPWLKVRVGQMKTPQGIEQPGNTLYTTMIERYPGDLILPGRDLGIKVWGNVVDDIFTYELMFANGAVTVDQNKSLGNAGPGDDELDFLMQVSMVLGKCVEGPLVKNLKFGYFHSTGEARELPLSDLRLRDSGTKILDFDNNSSFPGAVSPAGTAVQEGQRERDGVFFAWPVQNFGVQAEWVRLDLTLKNFGGAGPKRTGFIWAWFVDAVWVLTGEDKIFNQRIVPKETLDEGGAGAWELAFRFGQWERANRLDPFLEGTDSPRRVTNHTLGINWWPHENIRISLNYVYNLFEGLVHLPSGDVRAEHGILFRAQFGF